MSSRTLLLIFALLSLNFTAQAAEMGVPVQLRLRKPDTTYLNETGVDITVAVLSKTSCILRIEKFSNQTVTDGAVSVILGTGVLQITDPGLTLNQVYDNLNAKSNLSCVDASNSVISSNQTYTPAATDSRIMRVIAITSTDTVAVDFNMKAAPYAIQAESVGGKTGTDLLVKNSGTQLSQANLESLLADNTRLTNLLNLAINGQANSAVSATNATNATNAGTATNFTANLVGDVTGTQSATVVSKLHGVNLSATAPTVGQVLAYDGSQYIPTTPAAATVASVNGKTGAVNLTVADIPGAVSSSSSLSGDVTGTIAATVVSSVGGKSAATVATAVNTVNSATATLVNNTIVKRDGSGNTAVNTLSAVTTSQQQVNVFNVGNSNYVSLQAPNTFSNYVLVLPTGTGSNGQVLTTDGTGTLSWTAPGGVTSAAIITALGYTPANSATGLTTSTNFSGDVTGAYNSIALANSGVAAGTYGKVTVDTKGRVTSGVALSAADVTTALGYTPANNAASGTYVQKANNLSDLASATVARTNLGLGGAAVLNVGTTAGSVAAGNDSRITGAVQQASIPTCAAGEYLTYNGSAYSCSTDQTSAGGGVTSAAIVTALGYTPADNSLVTLKANNLSDLASSATARTNLGLGGAALLNVGTTAGTVAAGDDSRITGALQQTAFNAYVASATCAAGQSMYWNSVSSQFQCQNTSLSGDVTGLVSNVTVTKVQGVGVSFASIAAGHILQYNGSNVVNVAIPTCSAGYYLTYNGSAWSCALDQTAGGVTSAAVITALGYTPANSATALTTTTSFSGDVTGNYNSIVLANSGVAAGSYAKVTVDVKGRVTSGNPLSISDVTTALGYTPANSATALSTTTSFSGDVTGNYNSIVLANSGVTAGTYGKVTVDAKGRVTSGVALSSADVTTALGFTPANNAASGTYVQKSNNLSDLASATVARTNLGLGGAAVLNVGTTAGTVAAGDDSRITGALQQTAFNTYVASASCAAGQSMYWNSVSSTFLCANVTLSGDATGNVSAVTVTKLQGTGVSFASIANGHILQYNGTNIVNRAIPTCAAGEYLTFNGTAWSCVADAGAAGVIASLSVTSPISSTGGANPTLSIPQASGSQNGYLSNADWTTFNSKVTSSAAAIAQVLGYAPVSTTTLSNYAVKSNNLSDLTSATAARTNLGLSSAAIAPIGTSAGTVAAGNDTRIANALQTTTNFSGDISGVYNSIVLADTGVAAGTYGKVTVDSKGRVTSGVALSSADVTTALGYTPTTTSLASGKINIGNGSNVASAVTISGDATMTNAGVVALKNTGTAGTYGASNTALTVTTDAQGRVTAVTSNSISIVSAQVVDFASTVIGTVLPGFSAATATAVTASDSILAAIGKLQGQLNTLLNPATTMVSSNSGNITTTSTTDTAMTGMTITPAAGTYQVQFVTSVTHATADATISVSLYSGGSLVTGSTTVNTPRVSSSLGSPAAATLNQTVLGEVTVNGSQAIAIYWKTSTGTATSVGNRMMVIHRIR